MNDWQQELEGLAWIGRIGFELKYLSFYQTKPNYTKPYQSLPDLPTYLFTFLPTYLPSFLYNQ